MARQEAGHQLHLVQMGLEPSDCKNMVGVGLGVKEIRIHAQNEYRILYVARYAEGVYVLHVFTKKTRATSERDINLARARLRSLLIWRQQHGY